jgi:YD repeat-containing protein
VTTTDYNDRGEAWQVADPKATVKRAVFDDAGRVIQTIENYQSSGSGNDINKTTNFTYNGDGKLVTLTAINATTGNQVTTYVYGTTLSNSDVASSQLLRAVIYPDSTDSPNPLSGTDHVEYRYNRLGERKQLKDQRGTVHDYEYDKLGRLIHDRVTLPTGSSIDNAVLRISRTYEVRGMLASITGYNAATGGSVVNQCVFTYNDFAQLTKEEQAHSGAAGTGTPAVQYSYADGGSNTIRPTAITYPDGRELNFAYGD